MLLRRYLRAPWDYGMMVIGLSYWGIFGTLVTILCGILSLALPKAAGERIGRLIIHHLFRLFVVYLRTVNLVKSDLRGLESLKDVQGPFIAAPNHTSLWDVVFIIARLPCAVCIMKKQILCNFLLGGGARLAGYIANGCMTRMIRSACQSLEDGGQLLLFPEGTRTKAEARWINPLKGGCAIIATRARVPVYPIFIRSNTRFLQKGWPLWKRPIFPIAMTFDLGEPLIPEPGETPQEFNIRLAAIYNQELARPHSFRRQVDTSI